MYSNKMKLTVGYDNDSFIPHPLPHPLPFYWMNEVTNKRVPCFIFKNYVSNGGGGGVVLGVIKKRLFPNCFDCCIMQTIVLYFNKCIMKHTLFSYIITCL